MSHFDLVFLVFKHHDETSQAGSQLCLSLDVKTWFKSSNSMSWEATPLLVPVQ